MAATLCCVGCGKTESSSMGSTQQALAPDPIEGVWRCESATSDGKAQEAALAKLLTLTLTKDRYIQKRDADIVWDVKYAVDVSQQPPHINLMDTEGELKGIYSITNKTLRVCYAEPGKARPTAFDSAPKTGAFLFVWKRLGP